MRLICIVSLLLLICSCAIKSPKLIRNEHIQYTKMEGKSIYLKGDFVFYNPNHFSIKIKPSHVTLHIEQHPMGEIYLDQKIKLKSNRESIVNIPFHLVLEDGAMLNVMRYALKDSISIRMKGIIKGSVWLFSKKKTINQTQPFPGALLRLGFKH